jgi:hypothetical protein
MGVLRGLLAVLVLAATGADALGDEPVPRNVRIVVTGTSDRTSRRQGVEASGAGRVGGVRIGGGRFPPESGVVVRGGASRSRSRDETRQELLVMSGGRAEIAVAEEVPYQDWFAVWGEGHGLWQAGIRWKEVGARLVVEPTVLDEGTLRVRLTPAFSYWLDQRTLTTEVSQLTTEVVVREGQEIDLGSVTTTDRQFLERFLVGFDESGETVRLRITLRASTE